ncbi:hypothetical protein [Streptomyces cyaneofuscatus]|uniref:Uncharacterized protein n=1 Tax=Streptomyces cyaneofuscatus TaxID=66883 RepID=A0ABZ1F6C2_9ACTN|nr:hypothetical protein [Streptomyces cyaneofuscatus]WSB11896.1 hypothetical protein OG849_33850 [Streptomyces cyaneofuscatus]WSD44571.1 hypothetical protein OG857_01550 [Streptomyces cyaneofuscatus]
MTSEDVDLRWYEAVGAERAERPCADGGGMRSVCRSAQDVVSPGLAGMCRSIGR